MKTIKLIKRVIICVICILILTVSFAACGSNKAAESKTFPAFKATDFDGNEMDESIFSKNTLTVLNFWFNGCTACVNEMDF